MSQKVKKKSAIQTFILIGSIALISLLSENRQTAISNSLTQLPSIYNPPPNLLKPPKPKTPDSPAATPTPKPPEQPLVFAPPTQFRRQIVYRASINNSKVIALTFDDGPSPETLKILEVLQKHQVVATFFCLVQICESIQKLLSELCKLEMRSAILGITITTKLPKKQQRMKLIVQAFTFIDRLRQKVDYFAPPAAD